MPRHAAHAEAAIVYQGCWATFRGHMVGVVTLLFTDLVGSTRLLDELGDDASPWRPQSRFCSLTARILT